ncbi:MAG: serine hydrolase domain-containing protein [Bacteroidota bacterium]
MQKKYYYLWSCLLLLSACTNEVKKEKLPEIPTNPHLEAFVETYLQQFEQLFIETNTPGAALAIVRNDEVLHLSGYGVKSVVAKDSVDAHTVFRIGSLSKGFASVLAGILVEKGELKWTDKVQHFVPEFVLKDSAQSRRVNLIHLLSQSSGLPYHAYTNLVEAGLDVKNIAQQFRSVNLISQEGEIYAYQNAAYSLIGPVLEKVRREPLATIFEKELFEPLGTNYTSTNYESLTTTPNLALPHSGGADSWHHRKLSKKYYNAIPAGGINASISDMAKWLKLLLGNRPDIISNKTLTAIFQPRIDTKNKRRYFKDWAMVDGTYYGMGWRVLTNERDTFIYHGGYVNGYRGEILIHPREDLGICVLANAPSKLPNRAIPAFLETYAEKRDAINAWEVMADSLPLSQLK